MTAPFSATSFLSESSDPCSVQYPPVIEAPGGIYNYSKNDQNTLYIFYAKVNHTAKQYCLCLSFMHIHDYYSNLGRKFCRLLDMCQQRFCKDNLFHWIDWAFCQPKIWHIHEVQLLGTR